MLLEILLGAFCFLSVCVPRVRLRQKDYTPQASQSRGLNPCLLDHEQHISSHRDIHLDHWAIRDLSQTSYLASGVGTHFCRQSHFPGRIWLFRQVMPIIIQWSFVPLGTLSCQVNSSNMEWKVCATLLLPLKVSGCTDVVWFYSINSLT